MAKQATVKGKNNNLLVWVFGVLLTLIVIAVIAILMLSGRSNPNLNANFFKTDDTKYVVTSQYDSENNDSPVASYDIYYHGSDGVITGHEAYYEYVDEAAAEAALSYYESIKDEYLGEIKVSGKYVILVATPVQYDGLTLDYVKQWSEVDSSTLEDSEDDSTEEVQEVTTEESEVVEETD